ncbi:phage tail protein [Mediterraneibacter gnavus]|uniref:phage tail protein n=1 Tax=Mediterraneibacter gnavus TaxID=33038 RepID=UPI000467D60B|nr:collagen-like protein [Mediterraneibacter gnavus]
MDSIRIAILSANNTPVAFMDNAHKKSMHYWGDELHEYLQGTANTYTFTVNAKHPDAQHVKAGNKVAFTYKGKSYYLNIVNTDQTEQTITATAWSLSFELINEDAGEYKAGKAMSFEEYLAVFDAERTLKLGLNEVSDKRITNEWTGTTSVLKRLFSLANVFSAEIEFETVLNKDYSLKEIVLNVYREHSDTDSGVGEYRNDIVLRYGKGITGIRKTTDAEKLYTCIQPTGKDGLTINGLDKKEYDENRNIEYFTDGAIIRAPQARDRFPSNIVNKADAYILMRKEYDTDSKDKLYSMALSDLKTASEPVVTYEVDGYFDTNIGDTVRMQDQEWTPVLYLQARVSEQVRSLTNPKTAKTVFTNYKELTSEISDSLLQRMQDLINKNKVYTCSISTNNGIIFKNGIGSTTLTAYAYDNGVDVADKLQFRWSKDGREFYVGKSVTVNATDVDTKAVYSFEAMENGIKRGYYEVTITDVMDGEDGKDGEQGPQGEKGPQGATGATGPQGATGNGIKSITNYYLATASGSGVSASTSGWTTTVQAITASKKYLWNYEVVTYTNGSTYQSAPCIIGVYGDKGATGATGATGPSGIIVSSTAPSNPKVGQLWQTASGQPIKRWDGSRWVIHYIAVENLDVQTLSAIVANLGTVTAGLIKSKGGHFYINVDTGEIVSKSSDGTISVFVKKENIDMVRSFTASRYWGSRLNYSGLEFYSGDSSMADDIANGSMVCSIRGDEEMRDFSVTNINGDSIWLIRTIKQLTKSISYDSGTVKGPYTSTNSANNIRVELKRRGCMVTCKITMIAQFPGSGEYGPFNEVKIPVGYRPVMDFFAPYSEVSGPNIFGTGRYGIGKDGGIKIYVENAAWTERHATFTWITDD